MKQTQAGYLPLSLLNQNIKFYAKLIANRLQPILPQIIHTDQTGFVRSRETRDNTSKTLSLISLAQKQNIPVCLLSIDAEKAFDHLNWRFLLHSLCQINLGNNLINKIMASYTIPSAQVRTNGTLSTLFKINNGTRQGCPLSPLQYVITMEHLAIAIRNNPSIHGITINEIDYKTSLYAEDILLYITSPKISIPSILKELNSFGCLSNFKVNLTKSDLLNISLPRYEVSSLAALFPFHWQEVAVEYTGVKISTDLTIV